MPDHTSSATASSGLLLFAPQAARLFGERVAAHLKVDLAPSEEREFEGGEHKMRALCDVRGQHAFVLQDLRGDAHASANDRLCRLLFFAGSLKDAGAAQVTACIPYLAYARKDRRTKPHDPVATRYVAQLFEAMRIDRVVTLDVHNLAAFENAFRCETIALQSAQIFVQALARGVGPAVTVASPDVGGVKRARFFRERLESTLSRPAGDAFMDKKRSAGVVSGDTLVGDIAGQDVILVDDLIASGTTILRAVGACRSRGARSVIAVAAHAVFTDAAMNLFSGQGPDRLIVSDSIRLTPPFSELPAQRLQVCSVAPLFAEVIGRLHGGVALDEIVAP